MYVFGSGETAGAGGVSQEYAKKPKASLIVNLEVGSLSSESYAGV